jgi:DNA modification methylase
VKPYYHEERSGITIYHGDCREILPTLPRTDLVLTDPPYGIGGWSATGGNSLRPDEAADVNKWDVLPPDEVVRAAVAHGRIAVVWGGNYLCGILGAFRTPLIWDKCIRGMHFADGELAWTNFGFGAPRIFKLAAAASDARGARQHPTQKPVALMAWCIRLAGDDAQTIIDPFMGSGTTLVAAKDLGHKAIGIEIEERYCEIAAKRLAQEVLLT